MINLIEKYALKGKKLPLKVDIAILLSFVFYACFLAWRDQYESTKPPAAQPIQVNVPPVNMPAPQVVIEQLETDGKSKSVGFLQVGSLKLMPNGEKLSTTKQLTIRIFFDNKSALPLKNVRHVLAFWIYPPGSEREQQKRFDAVENAAHVAGKSHIGDEVGVNSEVFDTISTFPLTDTELTNLTNNSEHAYLHLSSSWTDMNGNTGHFSECWWVSDYSDLNPAAALFRSCPRFK